MPYKLIKTHWYTDNIIWIEVILSRYIIDIRRAISEGVRESKLNENLLY